MAPTTAAKLARRLLQLNSGSASFYFEVDTAENASVLAAELKALGCAVTLEPPDFRINVFVPLYLAKCGGVA